MSAEKPEKVKIVKDDKNRLACKPTSHPHSLAHLLFLTPSSSAPLENNTLRIPLSFHLGKRGFINSLGQGSGGHAAQEG